MDSQGVIQSTKVGYSSTDTVDWRMEEILAPITQEEYEQEIAQLEQ